MHARLHHAKGHAVLAEAALRCANQGVHAVLLGYGDEEAKLRELAALPRAKGRIHVIGQQQPVDTLASVAALDLYAYASLRESLPLAVLEAMAMGLPIVSSDVGDVASALGHGEAGVVVPPGDVTALANAIDALAADPVRRADLGRNAERAARSRFSPQRLAREVESAWIALRGDAR
jgi:glycosyltransferase involved in cell wall biosynthesis